MDKRTLTLAALVSLVSSGATALFVSDDDGETLERVEVTPERSPDAVEITDRRKGIYSAKADACGGQIYECEKMTPGNRDTPMVHCRSTDLPTCGFWVDDSQTVDAFEDKITLTAQGGQVHERAHEKPAEETAR